MSDNKVSICIPVYNGARHLSETLEAVIGQTWSELEILIQDNCSTDQTPAIIERFTDLDSRIVVERNASLCSMASNWNKVINRARGDFVLLLSADDLIDADFVGTCVEILESDGELGFVSVEHRILEEGEVRRRRMTTSVGKKVLTLKEVLLKNPLSINFTLFRRTFLMNVRIAETRTFREPYFTCDYDLWIRCANIHCVYYFCGTQLATYRVHGGSLSSNKLKMLRHTVLTLGSNFRNMDVRDHAVYRFTLVRMLCRVIWLRVFDRVGDKKLTALIIARLFKK